MRTFIPAILFLMLSFHLGAQVTAPDTIFTRDGNTITCKIREIGVSEIRYVQPQLNPDVVMVIEKKKVARIVYANGTEQLFEAEAAAPETIEQNSEELFALQRKNALKLDVLALAANNLTLTYERSLRPGRSIELTAGAIGLGFGMKEEHAAGILLKGGYKFARNPDFYLGGMRYAHILKGRYLKLELDFASYSVEAEREFFSYEKEKYAITKFAFLVVLGNQWVYDDKFLIDVYSGIGIGTNSLEDNDLSYPYGFATLGDELPLAFSLGVRMGFLFK